MKMEMKEKFWEKGIRFECQGTGQCCTSRGGYGFVYLSLKDRQVFAKYFKLSTRDFTRKYCAKTGGWYHLKEFRKECRFLEDKKCTVYEARPTQCRTWPFWPENMNARAWNRDVVAFCPGVGKGKTYSAPEISKLVKQDGEIFKD